MYAKKKLPLPHVFWNFVWSIASLWPKTLFLLYSSMEKMFDIQKIAKVLASKRLKNIPTEYFASYIGFLLLNFNFDINKKIGFKKCFLGFHVRGNLKFIWRIQNAKFWAILGHVQYLGKMSKNCKITFNLVDGGRLSIALTFWRNWYHISWK